jgi:hypothetical protein
MREWIYALGSQSYYFFERCREWESYLRRLDMVVEIVTERLNVRDDLISTLIGKMPWEKNCIVSGGQY